MPENAKIVSNNRAYFQNKSYICLTNVKGFDKMEAKQKTKLSGKEKVKKNTVTQNGGSKQKPKSKFTLFREKYPEGIGEIVNMRAVLR
jgi:hypothetical protein